MIGAGFECVDFNRDTWSFCLHASGRCGDYLLVYAIRLGRIAIALRSVWRYNYSRALRSWCGGTIRFV